VATVTKHQIDGYPVWVITDAYARHICKNWIHHYTVNCRFQISTKEDSGLDAHYFWKNGLSLDTYNSIFEPNRWLPDWNAETGDSHTEQDRHRTHVNLFVSENKFYGHTDVHPDARPGLVTLWFANPGWQSEWGGGFWLGKDRALYVPNVWNTLIMFPHQLHHETEATSDPDAIRLSVYSGYCRAYLEDNGTQLVDDTTQVNYWSRHPVQSRKIRKQIRQEYSIIYAEDDKINFIKPSQSE
jgi:hypothetical protein